MHRCVHLHVNINIFINTHAVLHLKERHCVISVAWFPLDAGELLEAA